MKEQKQEYHPAEMEIVTVDTNDIICSSITGNSIGSIGDSGTEF